MDKGICIVTENEEQTIAVGEKIAGVLQKGDVLVLKGDLGAGKTHFVKGIAKGVGSGELVTSPTFTILNVYEGGRVVINHFDMYRLSGKEEASELGFEEYFDRTTSNGVSVVEWPEQVEGLIKPPYYEIEIKKTDKDEQRKIYFRRVTL